MVGSSEGGREGRVGCVKEGVAGGEGKVGGGEARVGGGEKVGAGDGGGGGERQGGKYSGV